MALVRPVLGAALGVRARWLCATSNQYGVRARRCVECELIFVTGCSQSISNRATRTVVAEFRKHDNVRINRFDFIQDLLNATATAVPDV